MIFKRQLEGGLGLSFSQTPARFRIVRRAPKSADSAGLAGLFRRADEIVFATFAVFSIHFPETETSRV
jgi:hypothetical protein